jgi:hypothetical protein
VIFEEGCRYGMWMTSDESVYSRITEPRIEVKLSSL